MTATLKLWSVDVRYLDMHSLKGVVAELLPLLDSGAFVCYYFNIC